MNTVWQSPKGKTYLVVTDTPQGIKWMVGTLGWGLDGADISEEQKVALGEIYKTGAPAAPVASNGYRWYVVREPFEHEPGLLNFDVKRTLPDGTKVCAWCGFQADKGKPFDHRCSPPTGRVQ